METTPQTIEECYARAVAAFPLADHVKVEYSMKEGGGEWWVFARINNVTECDSGKTFEPALEKVLAKHVKTLAELARACPICGGKNYDEFKHEHNKASTPSTASV